MNLLHRTWRPRVVRYVMLFPGRTGSTYLTSALRDHPDVRATGELIGRLRAAGADAQLTAARAWLRGPLLSRERVCGFKTKLVDVCDRERFGALLDELDVRLVVLARENHVKHVVSRANAKRIRDLTNKWNRRPGDDALPPIEIDPEAFDVMLQRVVKHQSDIDSWAPRTHRPLLRLTYEELLADKQGTFDRLCSFLGVDSLPMAGRTEKATSDDLREALANYDDLRARYANSVYLAQFD